MSGGLQLKNLPTGPGDKLSIDATYTDGAPKYIIGGVTGNGFEHFSGGDDGFYNNFAFAGLFDGVFGNGTSIEKTQVWGFRGAFVHNWTPNWETSVFGSFSHVDYNGAASTLICDRLATTVAAPANGAALVPGTYLQPGLQHLAGWIAYGVDPGSEPDVLRRSDVHGGRSGVHRWSQSWLTAPAIPSTFKPPGAYDFKDQGIWSGNLRVRRTF